MNHLQGIDIYECEQVSADANINLDVVKLKKGTVGPWQRYALNSSF